MRFRLLAPLAALVVVVGALAATASAKTFQIDVTATDSGCKLALTAVNKPNTAILFHIINNGSVAHGIMFGKVKSHMFAPKAEGDLMINFKRAGTFKYACTAGKYGSPQITKRGTFTIRA